MEVLVLDGKNYVKATKAARDMGYASDYVGQLCRTRQIDAHLIGRTWYVNQDQLGNHRVEKRRMARTKAREHAKRAIEEVQRLRVTETRNPYRNIAIQYEPDPEDLIPNTRKLEVASTPIRDAYRAAAPITETPQEVINEGEKILMEGSLKVVDVTDAPIEDGTVILTPRKMRSARPQSSRKKRDGETAPISMEDIPPRRTFTERLEAEVEAPAPEAVAIPPALPQKVSRTEGGAIPYVLFLTLLFLAVAATIPYEQTITYSEPGAPILISYEFSLSEIVSKIRSRI